MRTAVCPRCKVAGLEWGESPLGVSYLRDRATSAEHWRTCAGVDDGATAGTSPCACATRFLDAVAVAQPPAMHTATVWRSRGDSLTPDQAGKLAHYLYAASGGAVRPHPRRFDLDPGDPADLVDDDDDDDDQPEPAAPGDPFADLPLFAVPAAPVDQTPPAPIVRARADGAARQLDMFAAAAITCPHCGARKTYSDGIDDAGAARRAYLCDSCRRTWSVDGAQVDMFDGSAIADAAGDGGLESL